MTLWTPSDQKLPTENSRIAWLSPNGDEISGGYRVGKLWFLPDGVYVYYIPVFWRYV